MLQKIGKMLLAIVAWGSLALFLIWVTFVRFTIDNAEYPDLLAACQQAAPTDREKMNEIAKEARGKSALFNFTRSERDRFLKVGGYCVDPSSTSGCKALPKGAEADGMAINIFSGIGCNLPPELPSVCNPTEPAKRC